MNALLTYDLNAVESLFGQENKSLRLHPRFLSKNFGHFSNLTTVFECPEITYGQGCDGLYHILTDEEFALLSFKIICPEFLGDSEQLIKYRRLIDNQPIG